MKRLKVLVAVAIAAMLGLAACSPTTPPTSSGPGSSSSAATTAKTIYVLGPTPDHGWTAQAGAFASAKVDEIKAAGKWNAQYMAASSGDQQNDIVQQIIANKDAAGVVFMALDDSAKPGQEALIAANIPFISFDRIIVGPDKSAILNFSGDNWAVGAGVAAWLQKNGMKAGDVVVNLIGDNGTVSGRRNEGFSNFLLGTQSYKDKSGTETKNADVWSQADVDKALGTYKVVCDWSADKALQYLEQNLPDIVKKAKAGTGRLFVYSMDDEMTFGLMNLLQGNSLDAQTKADFEALKVYVSAIGGMQELYDVMLGKAPLSPIADKYFDGLMSMSFNPSMMTTAIDYMIKYLEKDNWTFKVGDGSYEPTFVVDKSNAASVVGFKGHK